MARVVNMVAGKAGRIDSIRLDSTRIVSALNDSTNRKSICWRKIAQEGEQGG